MRNLINILNVNYQRIFMIGIQGIFSAIPNARITLDTLNLAWDRPGMRGGKAVAASDEDPIALSAEAVLKLGKADYLLFASTTPPLLETSPSGIISAITDQDDSVKTADFTGSTSSSTKAVSAALDYLSVNEAHTAIVSSGEIRIAEPGSMLEPMFGDAGAAIKFGKENPIAHIKHRFSFSKYVHHTLRREGDLYITPGDFRYTAGKTVSILLETVKRALAEWKVEAGYFDKWVISAPDPKSPGNVLKKLGLNPKEKSVFPPAAFVGYSGTPDAMVYLNYALENSQPGEKIAWLNFGDGADFFALETTDSISVWTENKPLSAALKSGRNLPTYNHYLRLKGLIKGSSPIETGFTSAIMLDREEWALRLRGRKCGECGSIITLEIESCPACGNHENFTTHKLSRTGTVFTFTNESYFPAAEPPLGMAVIDLDSGGRITVQTCSGEKTAIGDRVELVPRRYHDIGKIPHYFWKARKISEGAAK